MKRKRISKIKIIFGVLIILISIMLLYDLKKYYFGCETNYKILGDIKNYEIRVNNVKVDYPFTGVKSFDCRTECYKEYGTNSYKIHNGTLRDESINATFFSEICYCDLNDCFLKNLFKSIPS